MKTGWLNAYPVFVLVRTELWSYLRYVLVIALSVYLQEPLKSSKFFIVLTIFVGKLTTS